MPRYAATRVPLPLLLLLAACGDPAGPAQGDVETITELPRALTVAEESVIRSGNTFGLELIGQVVQRDERPNVVLSPFSASMALGMTLNGAAGTTFEAMRGALGFDEMTQEQINEAYSGLLALLTELDPEVRFDIANSVWANEDIVFHQAFLDAVAEAFHATVESRDFGDPSTLAAINDWVSDSTDGLIAKILDQLNPDLVSLLINAIYFEGSWTTEFDPDDTRRREFRREDGSTVQVDMMTIDGVEFPIGFGPGWAAVELPYGGEAYSMVVVVPNGGGARDFVQSLDDAGWQAVLAALSPQEVDLVAIPRFTLRYDTYLNDALKAMGMEVAFGRGADFTRMSPAGDRFCIDFVRQKTFIEVDERGTRAAAVTAVGIGTTSFTGVVADRPFVFAIRERLSGTILFMGLVGDPTFEDPGPEELVSDCR